jgi:hypothetical protein
MRNALLPVALLVGLSSIHCSAAEADSPPPCTAGVVAASCSPAAASPRLEVVDDDLTSLQTFRQTGRSYVLGQAGARYRLHVVNPTGSDVEAVVSVDGLDAVDGKPASLAKRGYIVPAYGDVTIDGWRTSLDDVAAFRFGSVRDSYAARTGHARNVGVIGVAFFRERVARPPQAVRPADVAEPTPSAPAKSEAASNESRAAARDGAGAAGAAPPPAAARPGLGTEFGEAHESHVSETSFTRADARPMAVQEVRYDDRQGLVARGILPRDEREEENQRRDTAQAFPETRFAQAPR